MACAENVRNLKTGFLLVICGVTITKRTSNGADLSFAARSKALAFVPMVKVEIMKVPIPTESGRTPCARTFV